MNNDLINKIIQYLDEFYQHDQELKEFWKQNHCFECKKSLDPNTSSQCSGNCSKYYCNDHLNKDIGVNGNGGWKIRSLCKSCSGNDKHGFTSIN